MKKIKFLKWLANLLRAHILTIEEHEVAQDFLALELNKKIKRLSEENDVYRQNTSRMIEFLAAESENWKSISGYAGRNKDFVGEFAKLREKNIRHFVECISKNQGFCTKHYFI